MNRKTLLIVSPLLLAAGITAFIVLGLMLPSAEVNSVDTEEPKRTSETFYLGEAIYTCRHYSYDHFYYFHGFVFYTFQGTTLVIGHEKEYLRASGMANLYLPVKVGSTFRLENREFKIEMWTDDSITLSWDE